MKPFAGNLWDNPTRLKPNQLPELLGQFKSGRYRAPAIRRTYILKGDGKQRPLGLPTVQDKVLAKRLRKYGLSLHPEKTKLVEVTGRDRGTPSTFDFLGITHYMGKSRKGKRILKRKTSKKKLKASLQRTSQWMKTNRGKPVDQLIYEQTEEPYAGNPLVRVCGERGGNEPLYPEDDRQFQFFQFVLVEKKFLLVIYN